MSFNFDVFVPFEKISKSEDISKSNNGNYLISGYASTGVKDLEGETIEPDGIDCTYLKNYGFIDYEHNTDDVIGIPTDKTYVDDNGLFLEAELFKDDPNVSKIMKLYKNLSKAKSPRKLGFSIEGVVNERDLFDKSIIRDVLITGVAVTKNPANVTATWDLLTKSVKSSNPEKKWNSISKSGPMTAGDSITPDTQVDGAALRPECFADHISYATYTLSHYKELGMLDEFLNKVADCLDSEGCNMETKGTFLQLATGISKESAIATLGNFKSGTEAIESALDDDADSYADDDDDDDDS